MELLKFEGGAMVDMVPRQYFHLRKCTCSAVQRSLSRLIWTPLKLVPPGTNFSEIFGPTLKNLFLL